MKKILAATIALGFVSSAAFADMKKEAPKKEEKAPAADAKKEEAPAADAKKEEAPATDAKAAKDSKAPAKTAKKAAKAPAAK